MGSNIILTFYTNPVAKERMSLILIFVILVTQVVLSLG